MQKITFYHINLPNHKAKENKLFINTKIKHHTAQHRNFNKKKKTFVPTQIWHICQELSILSIGTKSVLKCNHTISPEKMK